jgi:phosphoribosyl 1,2-cyclic phosphate phosphodiesterase
MPNVLEFPQGTIQSTLLPHGGVSTLGLVFREKSSGKKFSYYTDCKRLTHEAVTLASGSDVLVIDGLRPVPHPSHLSITEAVAAAQEIGAHRAWLTHLTHVSDHATVEATMPPGVKLGYDGLRIQV